MRRLSKVDEKEHVEPLQEDGVNREEVSGDDRRGVGGKEATPGERGATWRRRDAVLTQDPANGAGRDLEAELAELALEAEVAPATVLLRQLADQLPALFADRGSTPAGTTCEARPLPTDQLAVPAEHRFRLDQQRGPSGPWQPARHGGEDETIGLAPADNLHLAFKDADLVAQHQQLGLISGAVAEGCEGEVDNKPEAGVKDEEEHGRRLIVAGLGGPPLSSDGLLAPHSLSSPSPANRQRRFRDGGRTIHFHHQLERAVDREQQRAAEPICLWANAQPDASPHPSG